MILSDFKIPIENDQQSVAVQMLCQNNSRILGDILTMARKERLGYGEYYGYYQYYHKYYKKYQGSMKANRKKKTILGKNVCWC